MKTSNLFLQDKVPACQNLQRVFIGRVDSLLPGCRNAPVAKNSTSPGFRYPPILLYLIDAVLPPRLLYDVGLADLSPVGSISMEDKLRRMRKPIFYNF
jgi:hypothetical protein